MKKENVKVIYEDGQVLVINKPAGLVVHGDGRTEEYTLSDWVLKNYPEMKEVGEVWENQKGQKIYRPGIVHRLDRDTSGVMIIAKTQESYEFLKSKFKERDVKKEYRALVYGAIKEEKWKGVIDKPIGKSPSDFRKWSAQPGSRGVLRDAQTEYKVLSVCGVGNDGYSYIAAFPRTGRTHQIRVHFKAIHHSVVADNLYAPKKKQKFDLERQALHAYALTIDVPQGEQKTFIASIPDDIQKAIDYSQKSC